MRYTQELLLMQQQHKEAQPWEEKALLWNKWQTLLEIDKNSGYTITSITSFQSYRSNKQNILETLEERIKNLVSYL